MTGVKLSKRIKVKKRGRTPMPVEERRSEPLSIDVTPREDERLEEILGKGDKKATMAYRCFIIGLEKKEKELSK